MKKFKKMFAVMLSLAMVLGMSLTTFAEGTKPTDKDSENVTIKNVEDGSTLTAYQIIDAKYNDTGFVRYEWVEGAGQTGEVTFTGTGDNAVVNGLTSDMITNLAKDPTALKGTKYDNFDPKTQKLEVGTWMILVTPKDNASKIYNPMVVSVYYTVGGNGNNAEVATKPVDANTSWGLATNGAFAKSSEVKVEKTVSDSSQEVGQTVTYTITGTIPSYGAEYTNPSYEITDNYTHLTEQSIPEVTIGGESATDGNEYDYEAVTNGFKVKIKDVSSYADKSEDARKVVITYTAKIAATATVNDPATNTANVNYTHKPGDDPKPGTPTNTYTYTFAIEDMFKKVGNKNATDEVALAGATFTLFKNGVATNFTCETVIGQGGVASIHFEGLAEGTYTMKETVAPEGYSLSDKEYTIVIGDVEYDNATAKDKKVTSYTVTISCPGETTQKHTYEATNGTFNKVENAENSDGTTTPSEVITVQNTTLSSLPSTGGIGTTIFTIGGCAIMIIAAGLFFASRRKSSK